MLVQSLLRAGWWPYEIDRRAGWPRGASCRILTNQWVETARARAAYQVFEHLAVLVPPTETAVQRSLVERMQAKGIANDWPMPFDVALDLQPPCSV